MHTLSEEYARRTVQLRNHDALGTVDDESAVVCHVRNCTEEDVGDDRLEVRMVLVRTVEFHLCLHRHTVRQSALQTLLHGVARRVDEVVKELEYEVVASVGNREVLCEHLIQTVLLALLRWSVELKEIAERLQLHVKKIRIRHRILHACEANSVFCNFGCHALLYI